MSSLSCILRSSRPSSLSFTCEAALALPPAVESRVGGREPPGLIPRLEEGEPQRMTRGGDIELILRRLLALPPRDGVEARGACWVP